MENLETRIRILESQLTYLRGAGYAVSACVLAFLGFTILGVPAQITKAVEAKIGTDTESHAKYINQEYNKLISNPHVLLDTVAQEIPKVEQGRTPMTSGSSTAHVTFTMHFTQPPKLMIALGHLDESGAPRVHLDIAKLNAEGFDYSISTFAGPPNMPATGLGQADILWMAVGK